MIGPSTIAMHSAESARVARHRGAQAFFALIGMLAVILVIAVERTGHPPGEACADQTGCGAP